MARNDYSKEILDYTIDRELRTDVCPAECDHCKETSILVEDRDLTYRNMGAKDTSIAPLCISCYFEVVVAPMDEQWEEYIRSVM